MRHMISLVVVVGFMLPGCARTQCRIDPTRAYPEYTPRARTVAPITKGTLTVRTDTFLAQNRDAFPLYQHHAYSIYDSTGRLVRRVSNDADTSDGSPDTVTLPAGRYLIRLTGGRRSGMTFWVAVEPGRLTDIDTTRRS